MTGTTSSAQTDGVVAAPTPQAAARIFCDRLLGRGRYRAEALHEYTDEAGRPLFWRIRARLPSGDKQIRPMRPEAGGYALGEPPFNGRGRPLYRLHELAAADAAATIWFVEGESCADALVRVGLIATTAGSATSDERADFEPLRGRRVVVWPDNDDAGRAHAARVVARLRALGCTVEVVDIDLLGLPSGGDVVDWLRAHPGATAADVERLPRRRDLHTEPRRAQSEGRDVVLVRMSDVSPQPIRWLWPGRIARGALTVIAGNPGLGKSQVSIGITAVVTRGGPWPVDRSPCEPGDVLLLTAEDDVARTVRPRLDAAGADSSRVHVLDAVVDVGRDGRPVRRGFSIASDIDRLETVLRERPQISTVIIDPVAAYMIGIDTHVNADVRAALAPLAALAERYGVAVIVITHLNKTVAGDALSRISGSVGFTAAARAVWLVVRDPEDSGRRLFLPAKNNLAADGPGLAFTVRPVTLPGGIETSRIEWDSAPVATSADEALRACADDQRSATDEAVEFLKAMLAGGPMRASDVQREARAAGIGDKPLRMARERLGIRPRKRGMVGGWWWSLPGPEDALTRAEDAEDAQDALIEKTGIFGDRGHLRGAGPVPAGDLEAVE